MESHGLRQDEYVHPHSLEGNANILQSDHQSVIESWPASVGTNEGMSSVKVPTEIRYTPQGIEWGFQIPATVERHQWFKL